MLDDSNVIKQRDPQDALGVAAQEYTQLTHKFTVENAPHGRHDIRNVIVTGMGGSALAAGLAKNWLQLSVPFEVVRQYDLPAYVSEHTLVIASSYSGNTEETLSAHQEAADRGAVVAVLTSGGKLLEAAQGSNQPAVVLPNAMQPRMAVLYNLKALALLLEVFGLTEGAVDQLTALADWARSQTAAWVASHPEADNVAKQLAQKLAGKTPVFYAGSKMAPVAYKWKISANENAKNVAFWNELSEFNHNEFIGWTSHPVEKPFAVVDIVSNLEHPQVLKRFEVSDRLLSGLRPASITVNTLGDTLLAQMVWASILGDFVGIYLAILNGVNPTPVDLIEKLKKELA